MSLCFTPACPRPENPDIHRFCHGCGARLRLGDRYEAVQRLGGGVNSQTWLGRDRHTLIKPQRLIKRFTPTGATARERAAAADRFRQTLAHLGEVSQHPQLPSLLGYFEQGDDQYLVQDYVVGERLDQRLQAWGVMDVTGVRSLLTQILPLLHHLHGHHVIHRDIKPANLLRPPPGDRWWLVDLGAAKPLLPGSMPQPGTRVGSVEYAAPEQVHGEATYGSDLYSLGVVCLHALTGLNPFDLFDGTQGCWRWRSLVPDVDTALADLLDHLVQPRLKDRLPSAAAGCAALGLSVPVPTSPRPSPGDPPPIPWQPVAIGNTGVPLLAAAGWGDRLLLVTQNGDLYQQSTVDWTIPAQPWPGAPPAITAIAVHPQQTVCALGTRAGHLWLSTPPSPGTPVLGASTHPWRGPWSAHQGAITQIAFLGSELVITGTAQGALCCWHWPSGALRQRWTGGPALTALAVDGAGPQVAVGDRDGAVHMWAIAVTDPPSPPYRLRTLTGHGGAISAL
ncbi:MAG: protein kinase, partial [Leptolyngbya sp.]|nr:protein kinase [Leptolyngbya sp.]